MTTYKCPICGWESRHYSEAVATSKLDLHIRHGHTQDEVNTAVDNGLVLESKGKFRMPDATGRPPDRRRERCRIVRSAIE